MKILMLGWEFPPHISGGLGTACEGLTLGLARKGAEITFVVPHLYGGESAEHIKLVNAVGQDLDLLEDFASGSEEVELAHTWSELSKSKVSHKPIPSLLQPYFTPESFEEYLKALQLDSRLPLAEVTNSSGEIEELERFFESSLRFQQANYERPRAERYGWDIFQEVSKYATQVCASLKNEKFDLIHCHDWMTFPAGVALARLTGKPLVTHVHSLEIDRSGAGVNQTIYNIERWGTNQADAVIAVSYYTKDLICRHLGVDGSKVSVVHNGVYSQKELANYRAERPESKIILFLGRITFQKGPDYFVEAAAKVIPFVPDALFVMAGSGDMLPRVVDRVKQLGIEKHFKFPGFLKGDEVEEMFSSADLYVMPSVSEPFGISALEAIKFETPVIISRQSGVSEVLRHALKVDFWDVDRMADLMINALLHPELRADLVNMAREEIKRLHWDAAAKSTIEVYRKLI